MNRFYQNVVCPLIRAGILAAFVLSQGVGLYAGETQLWSTRRNAARRVVTENHRSLFSALPPTVPKDASLPKEEASIPAPLSTGHPELPLSLARAILPYGSIQSVHLSQMPHAPLIVLIQDAHEVEEAQLNTSALIQGMGSPLVGLEGAAGPFHVAPYRGWPDKKATQSIAGRFLQWGYLSGAEYAAVTSTHPPVLWGVESQEVYRENIRAYRDAVQTRPVVEKWFQDLEVRVRSLKNRTYSEALKKLDEQRNIYQNRGEGLGDYGAILVSFAAPKAKRAAPELQALLRSLSIEKTLDFKKVEEERTQLLSRLAQKMGTSDLKNLLDKSLAYRSGLLGHGAFQRYLKNLCRRQGMPLSAFPHWSAYTDYVGLVDRIDRSRLLNELSALEISVPLSLANTSEQKILVKTAEQLTVLRKLIHHQMSSTDWENYAADREDFRHLGNTIASLDGLPAPPFTRDVLRPFEDFCRLALERNRFFVDRLLAKMKIDNRSTAALVAGGFHTEGLTRLLTQAGASSVVVVPKVTKVTAGPPALDVFVRNPLPLEKLFAGEKVSLKSELLLAEQVERDGNALWRRRALERGFVSFSVATGLLRGEPIDQNILRARGFPTVGEDVQILPLPGPTGGASAQVNFDGVRVQLTAVPAGSQSMTITPVHMAGVETEDGVLDVQVDPAPAAFLIQFLAVFPQAIRRGVSGFLEHVRLGGEAPDTWRAGLRAFQRRGEGGPPSMGEKRAAMEETAREDIRRVCLRVGLSAAEINAFLSKLVMPTSVQDIDSHPESNLVRAWIGLVFAPQHENRQFVWHAWSGTLQRLWEAHGESDEVLREVLGKIQSTVRSATQQVGLPLGFFAGALGGVFAAGTMALFFPTASVFNGLGAAASLGAVFTGFGVFSIASAAQIKAHRAHNIRAWRAGTLTHLLTMTPRNDLMADHHRAFPCVLALSGLIDQSFRWWEYQEAYQQVCHRWPEVSFPRNLSSEATRALLRGQVARGRLQETKGQYAVTLLGQKEIVQVELVRRAFSEHYYRQLLSKVGTKDKSLPKRRTEELGALPNLLSGHVRLFQGLLSDPTEQEKNIETFQFWAGTQKGDLKVFLDSFVGEIAHVIQNRFIVLAYPEMEGRFREVEKFGPDFYGPFRTAVEKALFAEEVWRKNEPSGGRMWEPWAVTMTHAITPQRLSADQVQVLTSALDLSRVLFERGVAPHKFLPVLLAKLKIQRSSPGGEFFEFLPPFVQFLEGETDPVLLDGYLKVYAASPVYWRDVSGMLKQQLDSPSFRESETPKDLFLDLFARQMIVWHGSVMDRKAFRKLLKYMSIPLAHHRSLRPQVEEQTTFRSQVLARIQKNVAQVPAQSMLREYTEYQFHLNAMIEFARNKEIAIEPVRGAVARLLGGKIMDKKEWPLLAQVHAHGFSLLEVLRDEGMDLEADFGLTRQSSLTARQGADVLLVFALLFNDRSSRGKIGPTGVLFRWVQSGWRDYFQGMKEAFHLREGREMPETMAQLRAERFFNAQNLHGIVIEATANMVDRREELTEQELTAYAQIIRVLWMERHNTGSVVQIHILDPEKRLGADPWTLLERLVKQASQETNAQEERLLLSALRRGKGERFEVRVASHRWKIKLSDILKEWHRENIPVHFVDVFALDAAHWDMSDVVMKMRRLWLMLADDVFLDSTEELGQALRNINFLRLQA